MMLMELEDDRKKLISATKSLEKLKKHLTASNENCSKMGEILTHFDERLSKLEETVQPVYKETGNLQKQQENIVSTLNRLDYVIKFYTVAGEVEAIIVSGLSSTTFELYLRDLDRLTEAVKYFEHNNPESPEMMNVSSLLEKGGANIEKEFRLLLARHSAPIPVKSIISLINATTGNNNGDGSVGTGNDQHDSNSNTSRRTSITSRTSSLEQQQTLNENAKFSEIQLPEKSRHELRLLAEWLCENRNDDFITVYAMLRSEVLQKSLNNLWSHLKSSSLSTVINSGNNLGLQMSPLLGGRKNLLLKSSSSFDSTSSSNSPMMMQTQLSLRRSSKVTTSSDGRSSDGGRQSTGLMKKFHDVNLLGVTGGSGGGSKLSSSHGSGSSANAGLDDDYSVSEREIISYVTTVTGLYKLMQLELQLLESIIPRDQQRIIFSRLVIVALDSIFKEGDSLASRVKKCVIRQDFSSALCLLPVYRYHTHMRHSFDLLLDGCEPEVQNKLHSLGVTLQTTISRSLEEFIDYIKSDVHQRVPKDGTVHELTSNVMLFLVHLNSYLDILSRVVTVPDIRSLESSTDKNRLAFAQYISRVLSSLGLTLLKKSEAYNYDPYLQALFRLNNVYYILKTLRKSMLLSVLNLYSNEIESHYEEQIKNLKREYLQSWNRVLTHVLEVNNPMSQQRTSTLSPPSSSHYQQQQQQSYSNIPSSMSSYSLSSAVSAAFKLKDKDRQNIKDKFSGFNKEFETIHGIQKGYAIPDGELREVLKRENCQYIVPRYAMFYNKYCQLDFTKNVHKYIRYTPKHVEDMIGTFFDSAA